MKNFVPIRSKTTKRIFSNEWKKKEKRKHLHFKFSSNQLTWHRAIEIRKKKASSFFSIKIILSRRKDRSSRRATRRLERLHRHARHAAAPVKVLPPVSNNSVELDLPRHRPPSSCLRAAPFSTILPPLFFPSLFCPLVSSLLPLLLRSSPPRTSSYVHVRNTTCQYR